MKIAVRRFLALAVTSYLAMAAPLHAGSLNPGQSATVQPGDLPEAWLLINARLIVNPGGKTLGIDAHAQSTATLSGAEMSASAVNSTAIRVANSVLTLTQSTVNNTGGRGVELTYASSQDVQTP